MKTIIAFIITTVALAQACQAANLPLLSKEDKRPTFYTSGLTLEAFGTGRADAFSRVTYGGGIGADWFLTRNAGVGVELRTEDVRDSFFDVGAAKLIGRLPWNRFALNFGIGSDFSFERDRWSVFAEAGPEFRLTKRLGIFGALRGVRPISDARGEHVLAIAGVRTSF